MLINFFSQGNPLPRRYGAFPPELVNMPLGDINIKWENKNYYSRLTKKSNDPNCRYNFHLNQFMHQLNIKVGLIGL